MDREDFIATLTGIAPLMRDAVLDAVTRILALAYVYKEFVEGEFRFEDFPDLNERVNAILRGLSDKGAEIARQRVRDALALLDGEYEDYEDIVEEVENENEGMLWAFDMHSSNLKKLLEGWLTIAFANGWSQADTLAGILSNLDEPQTSPMWRDAIRAKMIDPNEYRFGRGYQRNIPNAMRVLAVYIITKAFMLSEQRMYANRGAAYYIRRRGSNYDCPECDSLVGYPIPIDEPFVMLHPNCLCIAEYHFPPTE